MLKKNQSLRSYLRIFSLLFSLPIIIIAVSARMYFNGPIIKEYINRHNESVKHEVAYISEQLGQIEISSSNLGQTFQKEFQLTPIQSIGDFQQINRVAQQLFFFSSSNSLIKESMLLVFNTDGPFVISEGGTYTLPNNKRYNEYKITNERSYQWKTNKKGETVFLQDVSGVASEGTAYLVTIIDKSEVLNLLKVTVTDVGSVALAVDNQLIISIGELFNRQNISQYLDKHESWQEKLNGTTYNFVSLKINRLSQNWYFYSATPIDIIVKPILFFSNIFFAIGMLFFILSIIWSQIFAKKTYQPIDNLMIELFGDARTNNTGNEFEYLISQWNIIEKKRSDLEYQKSFGDLKVKQAILGQVIEGKYSYLTEEELKTLLIKNHWTNKIEHYKILYIYLTGNINDSEEVTNASQLFILENLILDIAYRAFSEYVVFEYDENGLYLFVVNSEETAEEAFFEEIQKYVNRVIQKYVVVAVGIRETEISQLASRMIEMKKMRDYQKIIQENQVIFSAKQKSVNDYLYPNNLEQKILGAFERSELSSISLTLDEFIQNIYKQNSTTGVMLLALGHLYDQVKSRLQQQHVSEEHYISKKTLMKKIERKVSLESISSLFFEDYLKPASLLLKESHHSSTEEAVYQVLDYVNQCHCNPDLSLESLADKVGIESSYLSREFKRVTKMNFIDYLTDFRLEVSKQKLAQSNMRINEIAENIGYNPSYFNRLFKKKFGITPGQYRKEYGEG
ncbi:helix-turn-helix domain-containing protein [Enterococcus lemanii]|uniref:Helix-turn-helix domain-containing protein n=1 Tax=Enterococcus lemanii TaxID=1159752 RepID=A0ABV9MZY6_9ENTE|nr:helix-turn-helix domain-containing protein [Enterococcus lemanii]MBM7708251.1 AraC-like DNA-binding protein [Enterococcus lemanii]